MQLEHSDVSIEELPGDGFERVIIARDESIGYSGAIAVHSTKGGPALGGVRMRFYEDENAMVEDAKRLALAMSYKNAAAQLPFGGGKSVIASRSGADRAALLRAHAQAIHHLDGCYIGAYDVGTSSQDVEYMARFTPHLVRLDDDPPDASYYTARGVWRAMEAAAQITWGNRSLQGRRIAIQGCGKVGTHLALMLHEAGADLALSDVDADLTTRLAAQYHADVVHPDAVMSADVEILAPCAVGPVLTWESVAHIRAPIVVGAANCQLEEDGVADVLAERGSLYVPDYVANAGGVISLMNVLHGWPIERVSAAVDATYERVLTAAQKRETHVSMLQAVLADVRAKL